MQTKLHDITNVIVDIFKFIHVKEFYGGHCQIIVLCTFLSIVYSVVDSTMFSTFLSL